MQTITQKFIMLIGALGLFYLVVKSLGSVTVSTFLLYLLLTLVTRYPKVAITDPFILTDCTELFVFLAAINLGYPLAVVLMFLGIWTASLIEIRLESPLDSADRTFSMFIALAVFAFLIKMGISLITAIAIGLFVSSLCWTTIAFFLFNIKDASYFVVAFAKPIVFYRILTAIGLD